MTLWVHLVVEAGKFEDGQVIVPELNTCVEYEPALFGLQPQLHSLDDVGQEGLLLVCKLLLLLWGELTLILVFFKSHKFSMADLDIFLKKEFNLDFSHVDVGLTLSNNQIEVLLWVPFVLHAEGCCIECDLNKHLFEGKFADLSSD